MKMLFFLLRVAAGGSLRARIVRATGFAFGKRQAARNGLNFTEKGFGVRGAVVPIPSDPLSVTMKLD